MKILLNPDPPETGGDPLPPAVATATSPVLAPPPAAKIIAEGKHTERELQLERKLKDREMRLSQVEDENARLKQIGLAPAPAPKAQGAPWTFFDEAAA